MRFNNMKFSKEVSLHNDIVTVEEHVTKLFEVFGPWVIAREFCYIQLVIVSVQVRAKSSVFC